MAVFNFIISFTAIILCLSSTSYWRVQSLLCISTWVSSLAILIWVNWLKVLFLDG